MPNVPNGTRPLLVVRTLCTTCKEWTPCACYSGRTSGHALRLAIEAAEAETRAKQQEATAATNAAREQRRTEQLTPKQKVTR